VREIVEAAPPDSRIGALYASFMNTDQIAALGLAPLHEELATLEVADANQLLVAIARLDHAGSSAPFAAYVDTDPDNPDRYLPVLCQSGLSLPDESYYRDPTHADVLAQFGPHVARMFTLVGWSPKQAAADADRVVAVETALAAHHWDVVRDRDATATHNPMTFQAFAESAPGFDWAAYIDAWQAPEGSLTELDVREPSYFTGFASEWQTLPLADWRAWAAYHLIRARAPYLTEEVSKANFDFYGTVLTGAVQQRERWKRGVSLVEAVLGEEVGAEYVARHFPPTHKVRMTELVDNLIEAYRQSITNLDWMGEATKAKALEKLAKFTPKIGYPAKWRDYSDLVLVPDDLIGNVRRAAAFSHAYHLGKIGKPVDRDEWFMTPQTVNAYYNPGMNEIVFPAAILQPPFFNADADDAVNYGGIGAVIGHEIGHGFDDQGAKYDGDGRLANWWTDDDLAAFQKRTSALITQYDAYSPRQLPDDARVNGALTVGENIGDLGGLGIALKAYDIALAGEPAPVIDKLTGIQRVFLGFAQIWQAKSRDAEALRLLAIDPHSPSEFRCNGTVRNIDVFYTAFNVTAEHELYLPPAERVQIW
jgi:putative endopeptidase